MIRITAITPIPFVPILGIMPKLISGRMLVSIAGRLFVFKNILEKLIISNCMD